jgi:hypothetical protein
LRRYIEEIERDIPRGRALQILLATSWDGDCPRILSKLGGVSTQHPKVCHMRLLHTAQRKKRGYKIRVNDVMDDI